MIEQEGVMEACLVCAYPISQMQWTDLSGQVFCPNCGTAYQRQWGKEGRETPYCSYEPILPLIHQYYTETGRSAGQGVFLSAGQAGYRYPLEDRTAFDAWIDANLASLMEAYPEVPWLKVKYARR